MSDRKILGEQMDKSIYKDAIADIVAKHNRKYVLDLGAGTCKISKQIADKNIKVVAVDKYLDQYNIEKSNLVTYENMDLLDYVFRTSEKFDCLILSAVLHELIAGELKDLAYGLHRILDPDTLIIIREPYYYTQFDEEERIVIQPFKNHDLMHEVCVELEKVIPQSFVSRYYRTRKYNLRDQISYITWLNTAFVYSYGEESWEREMLEYRFTFSKTDLIMFLNDVFDTKNYNLECIEFFDESYREYFKKCGYSDNILNALNYTHCMMIAHKNK